MMNEQIKQFIEQSQKVVGYTDGGYTEIKALDPEKFALLLVRECIWEVVKDNEVPHNIQVLIGERFKQHFGVEK